MDLLDFSYAYRAAASYGMDKSGTAFAGDDNVVDGAGFVVVVEAASRSSTDPRRANVAAAKAAKTPTPMTGRSGTLSKLGKAILLPPLSPAGTVVTTAAAAFVGGGVATTGSAVLGSFTAVTEEGTASGGGGGTGGVAMTVGVMVVRRSWSTETALVTASTSIRCNTTR
jgi:hypothetical protein